MSASLVKVFFFLFSNNLEVEPGLLFSKLVCCNYNYGKHYPVLVATGTLDVCQFSEGKEIKKND